MIKKESKLQKIISILKQDGRVYGIFLSGSVITNNKSTLSDIDLWVIIETEGGLNSIVGEIEEIFCEINDYVGFYQCTKQHYFIIFKQLQLDLNFITNSQYYNLIKEKKIIYDKTGFLSRPNCGETNEDNLGKLFLIGYTTLERALSKYVKSDYFVLTKFMNDIRNGAILPILGKLYPDCIKNLVTVNIFGLPKDIQHYFVRLFPDPTKSACIGSIETCFDFLNYLYDIVYNKKENHLKSKIYKFLKENEERTT